MPKKSRERNGWSQATRGSKNERGDPADRARPMGPTGRSRCSGDSPVEVRCARRGLAALGFSLGYLCSVGTQADEANHPLRFRFWPALRSSGGAKKKSHDGATPRDTSPRIATMSTLTRLVNARSERTYV